MRQRDWHPRSCPRGTLAGQTDHSREKPGCYLGRSQTPASVRKHSSLLGELEGGRNPRRLGLLPGPESPRPVPGGVCIPYESPPPSRLLLPCSSWPRGARTPGVKLEREEPTTAPPQWRVSPLQQPRSPQCLAQSTKLEFGGDHFHYKELFHLY